MPLSVIIVIVIIILAIFILILWMGKKLCDMAIKPKITQNYSSLIFTEKQKEDIDKTTRKTIQWLDNNSREVEIISRDGLKLKGYEIKAEEESNIWVIAVHGYMSQGTDMVQCIQYFRKFGYNSLIIDLRAHGKSEGTYMGMG